MAEFDVCQVLTPEESAALGIEGAGERFDVYPETGCRFQAERMALILAQNSEHDGLELYHRNAARYVEFEENEIVGRAGLRIVIRDGCHQVVAAGSGNVVVQVLVHVRYEDTVDPCVEAYRIAEMIAPRLPPVED